MTVVDLVQENGIIKKSLDELRRKVKHYELIHETLQEMELCGVCGVIHSRTTTDMIDCRYRVTEALRVRIQALTHMLRQLQYVHDGEYDITYCATCSTEGDGYSERPPHTADCELWNLIEDTL